MKFNNIRLLVDDFDKCFTFYNNLLGLECSWGGLGDNYASFNIGCPSGLALFKADLMNNAINKIADGQQTVQDRAVIVLQVDNVDEVYAKFREKGVTFLTEPKSMSDWGIRAVHLRDPENNLIELYSELPEETAN